MDFIDCKNPPRYISRWVLVSEGQQRRSPRYAAVLVVLTEYVADQAQHYQSYNEVKDLTEAPEGAAADLLASLDRMESRPSDLFDCHDRQNDDDQN